MSESRTRRGWTLLFAGAIALVCVACEQGYDSGPIEERAQHEPVQHEPASLGGEPAAAASQQAVPTGLAPAQPTTSQQPSIPQLPDNVLPAEESLFAVDTDQQVFELELHGTRDLSLLGELADQEGRRRIVLNDPTKREPEVVFTADWLLPAVGAANRDGEILVCVNRLVGEPTSLTEGKLPDPSQGVDLLCRMRTQAGWQVEVPLPRHAAGHWLHDVTALSDGRFRVAYSGDSTGFVVDDPQAGDGMYRVAFQEGHFGTPELARKFRKPTE